MSGRAMLLMRIRRASLLPSRKELKFTSGISKQVVDELEPLAAEGGLVLDWHTCDAFPERWIDLVVVLQCDHTRLWERLEKRRVCPSRNNFLTQGAIVFLIQSSCFSRNYPLKKIQENNTCEIMGTVLEEAREAYDENIIVVLRSEETDDLENNVARITQWVDSWKADRGFT